MTAPSPSHPLAPPPHVGAFSEVKEHGSSWLVCAACGATWAIVETTQGDVLESVDDGDGYCEESS